MSTYKNIIFNVGIKGVLFQGSDTLKRQLSILLYNQPFFVMPYSSSLAIHAHASASAKALWCCVRS